jgi:hypothetical protein
MERMRLILLQAYATDRVLCEYLVVHMLNPDPGKRPGMDEIATFVADHPKAVDREAVKLRLKTASQKRGQFKDAIAQLQLRRDAYLRSEDQSRGIADPKGSESDDEGAGEPVMLREAPPKS